MKREIWGKNINSSFSCVHLFATTWTVAHQASLSMGFSRQEYWSGLPCPPPLKKKNQLKNYRKT